MPYHSKSRTSKTGGANKKMSKFPRILDYIEIHHKELYDVIEDLALHSAFNPRRGSGITFLVPEPSYVKEMRKQTESSDPEKATDMVYSLVIPVLLDSISAWSEMQDDIPNLLGKKIEIGSVTSDKITLKNSAVITPNSVFKPFDRSGTNKRGNMAVWNIKGKVDFEKAPEATRKYIKTGGKVRKRIGRKRGGNEHYDVLIKNFVQYVSQCELEAFAKKKPGEKIDSVKLKVLCNYLSELQTRADSGSDIAKNHLKYFLAVCDPLICGGIEAAFYLVFCCRNENRPGLHDSLFLAEIIGEDFKSSKLLAAVDKPFTHVEKFCKTKSGAGDYSFSDEEVEVIVDNLCVMRAKTPQDIVAAYSKYVVEKMPDGVVKQKFMQIPNLKLLIDEFKYICLREWKIWIRDEVDYDGKRNRENYENFLESLGNFGYPDIVINKPEQQSRILYYAEITKPENANRAILNAEDKEFMLDFLRPDGFWRELRYGKEEDDFNEPARTRSSSTEYDNREIKLSESTLNELKNYVKINGELPKI